MTRPAATQIDEIIKGMSPADIPVEQPTKFELCVNLKTARLLNLNHPANTARDGRRGYRVRRRDFTIGLLLASASRWVRAQQSAKQHRIAIILAGPVARIHDPGVRLLRAFFGELRRLGDVEGQNLTVDGYSHGGRPET
jgi:hypothetical protein